MSRKPNIDIVTYVPIFPGEIIVARKEAMNIFNTKIDDLALGIVAGLPSFTKDEKMKHYCEKLKKVWDGELCLK